MGQGLFCIGGHMNTIECKHLAFQYGDTPILDDITLSIPQGEFALVVGPNGSGKTTLLRLLAGLLDPVSGDIYIGDKPIKAAQKEGDIYMVPQIYNKNAAQFPATVEEIVQLGMRHMPKAQRLARAKEALELVDMSEYKTRRIGDLSGGQQQRVMIAQALANRPKLLLLDEPTSGIDFNASEHIFKVLRSLRGKEMTIIMVTHDVVEASKVADTVICVNQHTCYYGDCEGFLKTHMGTSLSWHIGG